MTWQWVNRGRRKTEGMSVSVRVGVSAAFVFVNVNVKCRLTAGHFAGSCSWCHCCSACPDSCLAPASLPPRSCQPSLSGLDAGTGSDCLGTVEYSVES